VIPYRFDERLGARSKAAESALSQRRARTRVVILDAELRIVTADTGARELLRELGDADEARLPAALEAALREREGDAEQDGAPLTSVPGFVVRSLSLDAPENWSALLVERVSMRENLEAASRRFGLSRREIDVLRLLLEGDSASEIAQRLRIGEYTVGDYMKRLFAKTQVRNRSEMIAKILGWVPPPSLSEVEGCGR
jgi:DNA-binding CsgD family transcriptional regulator